MTIVASPRVTAAATPKPGSMRSPSARTRSNMTRAGTRAPSRVSAQTIGVANSTLVLTRVARAPL